jgi:hypothetical protein
MASERERAGIWGGELHVLKPKRKAGSGMDQRQPRCRSNRHARVRVGPYRRWCPRPTGIDLGLQLSRRNVIVNRYQSTIAR